MALSTLKNQRVAILEDDPSNRERWTDMVARFGAKPIPIEPPAPALKDLEKYLAKRHVSMVLCDNRLFERGDYANYSGAVAVAASYQNGHGGVLVTAYENADTETFIRPYRRWIPVLIHSVELKPSVLESGLLQADEEVRGHTPSRERIPHRTIMTVQSILEKGASKIVKVIMSQWDAKTEIGFPLEMLPAKIRASVAPGMMLLAQVNIEASRAEDLFFEKFELPNPDVLKKANTILDRP